MPTDGAPIDGNYRAFGLAKVDAAFRDWTERLPVDIDRSGMVDVWERCLSAGEWERRPAWLHTDLSGDNRRVPTILLHGGSSMQIAESRSGLHLKLTRTLGTAQWDGHSW